ncbi:MAG: LGFP repeat-containing protein [Mycobacterium sp.]
MMRQQRRVPGGVIARAILVLLASAAAVVMLAAPASATPETDAADAINAAFTANGGTGGTLGAEEGDVYPVGTGFARNYAGGRILFTPATGARVMGGAILAKYDELGGAGDGDLGFPTADEQAGAFSPDARYITFADGVIYYTPAAGAWLVRGPINAAWDKLGSTSSPFGAPIDDARWDGPILAQRFTGGELSWDITTGAFTSVPPELAGELADLPPQQVEPNVAINAVWRSAGGPTGPLGAKTGDIYPAGPDGIAQDFVGGAVFFSTATGPAIVTGAILERYLSLGGPGGELGFPTASEMDGGIPGSRISSFAAQDKPVIFWTPENGAVVARGAINAAWATLGGAPAQIGVPLADQSVDGDVVTQRFSGGEISWNSVTQQYTTQPPELAGQLGAVQVPTTVPPSSATTASDELPAADGAGASFNWNWWWFAVPLLVLLLAVLGALLWRWERKKEAAAHAESIEGDVAAKDEVGQDEVGQDDGDHREYLPPRPERQQWQPGARDGGQRERWGHGGAPGVAAAVREPEEESEDDHGRHEVSSALQGWGAGQDDIDTDSFAPVADNGPSRHAAADADEQPTTTIRTRGYPPAGEPPRRTYSYEAVPMFEPWHPADEAPFDDDYDGGPDDDANYGEHQQPFSEERGTDELSQQERSGGSVLRGAHLPLADRSRPPRGYPIKGDAGTGRYYTPDNPAYASAQAEIWFDTEDSARASGFFRDR